MIDPALLSLDALNVEPRGDGSLEGELDAVVS